MLGVLTLSLVMACALPMGNAQNAVGGCEIYQGDGTFTPAAVLEMTLETEGYSLVAATAPGGTPSCARIRFLADGTYIYTLIDELSIARTYTGPFRATSSSIVSVGILELDNLPYRVLGANLLGHVRMHVLTAAEGRLMVVSCFSFITFGLHELHAFVPTSKYTSSSANEIISYLTVNKLPYVKQIKIVNQVCSPILRQSTDDLERFLKIYRFFAKIGIVPEIPNIFPFTENADISPAMREQMTSSLNAVGISDIDVPAGISDIDNPATFSISPSLNPYFRSSLIPRIQYAPLVPLLPTQNAIQYYPTANVNTGPQGSQIFTKFYNK